MTEALTSAISAAARRTAPDDADYHLFEAQVAANVAGLTGQHVFTTDADPAALWDAYLGGFPETVRQHYNCHNCRRFVQNYGGLVALDDQGQARSCLWAPGLGWPKAFLPNVQALRAVVEKVKVTGGFLTADTVLGTPQNVAKKTGAVWTHLHALWPTPFAHPTLTAHQRAAELKEEHHLLCRALARHKHEHCRQALVLLEAQAFSGSEKAVGTVRWLLALHEAIKAAPKDHRGNLLWYATATAPPGFAHLGSSISGQLLELLADNTDVDLIKRRFEAMTHPLRYQRAQTAPSAGAVKAAEDAFLKTGAAPALKRRFARLSEVPAFLWKPTAATTETSIAGGGIFAHLATKEKPQGGVQKPLEVPVKTMTWEKFQKDLLPQVREMSVLVPSWGGFCAVLTAADQAAPPILQWDSAERRNPFSVYAYHNGSPPSRWNLSPGAWVKVTAILSRPAHFLDPDKFAHHEPMALFVLEGCRDVGHTVGGGFFPSDLKAEYHAHRAVLENYAKTAPVDGHDEADVCGLGIAQGSGGLRLRAVTDEAAYTIDLDRWE